MKSFDRYSIRGIIVTVICSAGIIYEVFVTTRRDLFIIILYTIVLIFGLSLLFLIKDKVS